MAFAVATCPKCSESFRLVWRIGKRKLPLTAVIRLACPACTHSFEQVAVELTVFDAGASNSQDRSLWRSPRLTDESHTALLRARSPIKGESSFGLPWGSQT